MIGLVDYKQKGHGHLDAGDTVRLSMLGFCCGMSFHAILSLLASPVLSGSKDSPRCVRILHTPWMHHITSTSGPSFFGPYPGSKRRPAIQCSPAGVSPAEVSSTAPELAGGCCRSYRPSGRRSLVIWPVGWRNLWCYYVLGDAERKKTCCFRGRLRWQAHVREQAGHCGQSGSVVEGFRWTEPSAPHSS